jgi:hypothetical protein
MKDSNFLGEINKSSARFKAQAWDLICKGENGDKITNYTVNYLTSSNGLK